MSILPAATRLYRAACALDEDTITTRPGVSARSPGYGPRPPGDSAAIELEYTISDGLWEICCEIASTTRTLLNQPRTITALTRWMITHHEVVDCLEWVDDIIDYLVHAEEMIWATLKRGQAAGSIDYIATLCNLTRENVNQLAARGHITRRLITTPHGPQWHYTLLTTTT